MTTLNPVLVRNGLRYLAGALVARGLIAGDTGYAIANDPLLAETLTVMAGVGLAALTEALYALAKRFGWRT